MRFWLAALPWRSFCARTFTAVLAVALLLATLCQSQAADPKPKLVVMLHSFGLRFKPWTDYAQIIRSEISKHAQRHVDFHDHSYRADGRAYVPGLALPCWKDERSDRGLLLRNSPMSSA